jgi:hypothetical protein
MTEALRVSFKPTHVKVLYVGESAPAANPNGRVAPAFFYSGRGQVFSNVRNVLSPNIDVAGEFLDAFKAAGFYLDDLIPFPVDKGVVSNQQRKALAVEYAPNLAERIAEMRPAYVISLMRRHVGEQVQRAVQLSGTEAEFRLSHFPGNGQQGRFAKDMASFFGKHEEQGWPRGTASGK